MKPVLHRLMVVVVMVAFSFQGASGAMQRLLMPAHYHAVPEVDHDTSLVLLAMSDPDAQEEASPEPHGGPTHLEESHGHQHDPDPLCDHQCERPSHPEPATHQHPPALASGHAGHVTVDDARDVDEHALAHAHAHAAVLAHRHDRGRQDVVAVAEEVEMPASALRQHGLDGFWSLLPERTLFAVAMARDTLPALTSVPRRARANTAPRRPPRL